MPFDSRSDPIVAELAAEDNTSPPKPRFSWPMRLFLGFLLFDMVFHSFTALTPYEEWLKEFGMERFPRRLPTRAEIRELAADAGPNNPTPVADRVCDSLDAVWDYFKPWPAQRVRHQITDWRQAGKYAVCWLTSRLEFFEAIVGIDQAWRMFSPNASDRATVSRIRLLFADGTRRDVRLICDPEDLTCYSHWFQEKLLDCVLPLPDDPDARIGYCNYLRHRFPTNGAGSPLEAIYFYTITYYFPAPEEDACEVLRSQSGPPDWDKGGPDYVYDLSTGEMRGVPEEEKAALARQLAAAPPSD